MTAQCEEFRWRVLLTAGAVLTLVVPICGPTRAASFPELYTVTVEAGPEACETRGNNALRTALARDGMAKLLTRITGRQQIASYPEAAGLLAAAAGRITDCGGIGGGRVRVRFNAAAVNQSLDELEWPIWGAERPSTLLWIAVDFGDGERAELKAPEPGASRSAGRMAGVPSESLSPAARLAFETLVDELLVAADERGLPIELPRLDAEDRRLVRFADIWGGFDPFVMRASERYGVDAVLIGRVVPVDDGFAVRWTLQRGERRQMRETSQVRAGIDWLADEFAAQYITVGGASPTWITVQGIRSVQDFGRVFEYLQDVSIVESVDLESATADSLLLRLTARGDDAALLSVLTLDGELVQVLDDPAVTSSSRDDQTGSLVFWPTWLAPPEAAGRP